MNEQSVTHAHCSLCLGDSDMGGSEAEFRKVQMAAEELGIA